MKYPIKRALWSYLPPLDVEIRDDVPESERLRVAVVAAVQAGANLGGADLSGANLSGAYLSGANLGGANLSGAYLSGAYLSGAYLSGAYLSGANLRGANLGGAYLRGANLGGADLSGAYLSGANLRGADLPSPTMLLLASWGDVSDELCADLMLFDAACHPDHAAFDRWAEGGACPYSGAKVERAANFTERRDLWGKGEMCRPYDLAMRLIAEQCPEWSDEERVAFEARFKKETP